MHKPSHSVTRTLTVAGALALGMTLLACGGKEELTADSTCREFLDRPSDERTDATVRLSSEIEGVSSPGNRMWALSLEGACGSSPSMTLRQAFGGGADRPQDGGSAASG